MYEAAIQYIESLINDAQWANSPDKKHIHILKYIKENLRDRDGEILNDKKW